MHGAATLPPRPAGLAAGTRWWLHRLGIIIAFSVAFALIWAVVAVPVHMLPQAAAIDPRFVYWFAVLRWVGIIGIVVALFAARIWPSRVRVPLALQTPVTIFVLMTESVLVDIASARLF